MNIISEQTHTYDFLFCIVLYFCSMSKTIKWMPSARFPIMVQSEATEQEVVVRRWEF